MFDDGIPNSLDSQSLTCTCNFVSLVISNMGVSLLSLRPRPPTLGSTRANFADDGGKDL